MNDLVKVTWREGQGSHGPTPKPVFLLLHQGF